MGRNDEKGERFEELVARVDKAIDDGYYVEAMTITSSLIEERTEQLLKRFGLTFGQYDSLHKRIGILKDGIINGTITVSSLRLSSAAFISLIDNDLINSNLIDDIDTWRNDRNKAVHGLAWGKKKYEDLKEDSLEGKRLFRSYSSAIMRIKKLL